MAKRACGNPIQVLVLVHAGGPRFIWDTVIAPTGRQFGAAKLAKSGRTYVFETFAKDPFVYRANSRSHASFAKRKGNSYII